jgi:hypothetical protein
MSKAIENFEAAQKLAMAIRPYPAGTLRHAGLTKTSGLYPARRERLPLPLTELRSSARATWSGQPVPTS